MLYSFSEQVSPRHSDKIADQIADALLDAYLKKDDKAKTAIEVFIKRQLIFIGGEVNSSATIDHVTVVRNLLTQLRCTLETSGIDPITCDININIQHQSKELSEIANQTKILSADQSISVGYATNENKAFLPSSY
jgi:S-adenosylmethionine synthetase